MVDFESEIKKVLIKKLGNIDVSLEKPKNHEFGDYAFPCFVLSKQFKKNPVEIAKDLAVDIPKSKLIKEIKAQGPYLNFFINKNLLSEDVLREIFARKDKFGCGKSRKEKVMVEYCQVNTHKSFHVGHLRGTILGSSIVNILRFSGYKTLSVNYQGDIGTHVAKSIWYLKKHKLKEPKTLKGRWLGTIYQKANQELSLASGEAADKYKQEVSEILQKLEAGDKELAKIWGKTRKWCLDDFEKFYKELGVSFDNYFFESEFEKPGKELVDNMLKDGTAVKSEGAIIIDLQKFGLGNFLLLKSDGTALYSTKDLALAKQKFEKFKIDSSLYVVGSEQRLYFQQLFKTLELMGFKKDCRHISYELVNLEGGKISSREGDLIYAEDLLEQIKEKALKGVEERHSDWKETEKKDSAHKIAVGALKYSFLNQDNNKNIMFSPERSLAFEGETGPYVQYAHARICAILRKNKEKINDDVDFGIFSNPAENLLVSHLSLYQEAVEDACKNYQPQRICTYLFSLAKLFNEFYRDCPILKAEEKEKKARLLLVSCTKEVLKSGLSLLGIDAPERM